MANEELVRKGCRRRRAKGGGMRALLTAAKGKGPKEKGAHSKDTKGWLKIKIKTRLQRRTLAENSSKVLATLNRGGAAVW